MPLRTVATGVPRVHLPPGWAKLWWPADCIQYGNQAQPSKKHSRFFSERIHAPADSFIPLRLENPKIGRVDDAEIIGDRIAEDCPVFRYLLEREMQNRSAELVVGRVAAVVGYVPMHQSP